MQNECRQIIEQIRVVNTEHHLHARRRGGQRLDHPADELEGADPNSVRQRSDPKVIDCRERRRRSPHRLVTRRSRVIEQRGYCVATRSGAFDLNSSTGEA